MITSKEYWNRRSVLYDSKIGTIYHDAYQRTAYMSKKYLKATDRALDIGCGTGILTTELAPLVESVKAIDVSEKMMDICRDKLASRDITNVSLELINLLDLPVEQEAFDVIFAFNILNYLPDRDEAMDHIYRMLKPGGYLLTVTDCLGEYLTREGMMQWYSSIQKGEMPTVSYDTMKNIRNVISDAGFTILEYENLYQSPPNLFVAAQKPEETI